MSPVPQQVHYPQAEALVGDLSSGLMEWVARLQVVTMFLRQQSLPLSVLLGRHGQKGRLSARQCGWQPRGQ